MKCIAEEATYWYNVTTKDVTLPLIVPIKQIYRYEVWFKRNDSVLPMMSEVDQKLYKVGNLVWMK